MKTETPSERHERLVDLGASRYRETFIRLFQYECEGKRIPGMEELSGAELLAFFKAQPPEYFAQIAVNDPAEALRQVREFEKLEARGND